MLYLYLIIGVIIVSFTGSRIMAKNKEVIKQPLFWLSTIIVMITWPVIVTWAIYDLIRAV